MEDGRVLAEEGGLKVDVHQCTGEEGRGGGQQQQVPGQGGSQADKQETSRMSGLCTWKMLRLKIEKNCDYLKSMVLFMFYVKSVLCVSGIKSNI